MPNAEPTNINNANSPVGRATCLPTFGGLNLVGNKLPTLRLSKFDLVDFLKQKTNTASERINNLTHKMPAAFCTAKAPIGAMPGMEVRESVIGK